MFAGPPVVKAINRELNRLLLEDGFRSVDEAVGTGTLGDVDLKAVRSVMEEMVLEKFAAAAAAAKKAETGNSPPVNGEPSVAIPS